MDWSKSAIAGPRLFAERYLVERGPEYPARPPERRPSNDCRRRERSPSDRQGLARETEPICLLGSARGRIACSGHQPFLNQNGLRAIYELLPSPVAHSQLLEQLDDGGGPRGIEPGGHLVEDEQDRITEKVRIREEVNVGLEDMTRESPNSSAIFMMPGTIQEINIRLYTRYYERGKVEMRPTVMSDGYWSITLLFGKKL